MNRSNGELKIARQMRANPLLKERWSVTRAGRAALADAPLCAFGEWRHGDCTEQSVGMVGTVAVCEAHAKQMRSAGWRVQFYGEQP